MLFERSDARPITRYSRDFTFIPARMMRIIFPPSLSLPPMELAVTFFYSLDVF